ncbi:hypothetical protein DEU56DRAFT_414384 [Suillus clintonianus]|uniref:uncharacterized protein n=1 Tax=Suillus clintonianus TaxID=1904413 RepID=UPI001B864401|nr:uncharacterized protein DEU56DRAFT_414384 [Suillus clintonianus]KAG2133709.1 hypothetical protein DEU56DRAFT_414384 [Suillus clintonianus]
MVKKPPEAKYAVILEPLYVEVVIPTAILNASVVPPFFSFFLPLGFSVSVRCTSMTCLSPYAFTFVLSLIYDTIEEYLLL